jgi:hypothetical protein
MNWFCLAGAGFFPVFLGILFVVIASGAVKGYMTAYAIPAIE